MRSRRSKIQVAQVPTPVTKPDAAVVADVEFIIRKNLEWHLENGTLIANDHGRRLTMHHFAAYPSTRMHVHLLVQNGYPETLIDHDAIEPHANYEPLAKLWAHAKERQELRVRDERRAFRTPTHQAPEISR